MKTCSSALYAAFSLWLTEDGPQRCFRRFLRRPFGFERLHMGLAPVRTCSTGVIEHADCEERTS
jgi:hypothetical protein